MTRLSTLALFLCLVFSLQAQTATPAASLPDYLIGTGASWLRGNAIPLNNSTTFGIHIAGSSWYSTTTITTPIRRPVPGQPPTPSTITTGASYVVASNKAKTVTLLFTALGGVSAASAGAAAAPAFSGNLAVQITLGSTGVILEPYAQISNAAYSPTSGALATAVFSPALQVTYGFKKQ